METLLFRNQFRIPSARLLGWDYRQDGWYFVTICTQKRKCYFGKIRNNKMILSTAGKIAEKYWKAIPSHFPNIELETFIIMPNHIHGILTINNPVPFLRTTNHFAPLPRHSLPLVINHFKGAVKRQCNQQKYAFNWQPRFYDHIVRTRKRLYKISQYILNNPTKWESDRNNIENIFED
jgi:REP element-mobilizing transposase RayT